MKLENANYHESNAMAVLGVQAGPSDFMGFLTCENGQVPKVWDLSGLKAFGSRHEQHNGRTCFQVPFQDLSMGWPCTDSWQRDLSKIAIQLLGVNLLALCRKAWKS